MVTSLTKRDDHPDWNEYMKACRLNGEVCTKCGSFIYPPTGEPRMCDRCEDINKPGELHHDRYIRCPACGDTVDVMESEDYDLLGDGEHEFWCDKCDTKFTFTTNVTYSFVSPERKEQQ